MNKNIKVPIRLWVEMGDRMFLLGDAFTGEADLGDLHETARRLMEEEHERRERSTQELVEAFERMAGEDLPLMK